MAQDASTLQVIGQQACRHMLSKGMFLTGELDPAVAVTPMSDGYCWCNVTQGQMGPDAQLVERIACQAGRACYEPR